MGEWLLIAVIGALITALIMWSYERSLLPGGRVEHARAMAMVVLSCASASATAVLSRLRTKSAWLIVFATIGTSVALVQIPWFAGHLSLDPLHRDDWVIAACGGLLSVAGPVILSDEVTRLAGLWKKALAFLAPRRDTSPESPRVDTKVSTPPLTRYAWLSVLAAVTTIAMKSAAYYFTGSVALLSDAAESLVNLVGAGLAVVVLGVAARPADERHPFGHGKAEYFSSGFTGALILVAASGILWAAADRLMHPHPLADLDVGMVMAAAATFVNFAVAQVLLRAGRRYDSITL
jgi:predicted Co/Zn/Cd cation transporter (cation efflux family)